MKTPVWVLASALTQYYDGKSLKTIQEYLNQRYGAFHAKSSIYYWVIRFSRQARVLLQSFKPDTGDIWLACETIFEVGGRKYWFWDVVDVSTGYLLLSQISDTRQAYKNTYFVEMIQEMTNRSAKIIINVTISKNKSVSESVWYKYSKDIAEQNSLLYGDSLNTLDRFMSTLKIRRSVLRGFKNLDTARLLVTTWQLHYNFCKSFVTIGHNPPAQNMKNTRFNSWGEIIRLTNSGKKRFPNEPLFVARAQYLSPESLKQLPIKGKYRNY